MGSNLQAKEYNQAAKITVQRAIFRDWYLYQEERELLDKWYIRKWSQQFFAGSIRTVKPTLILNQHLDYIHHDGVDYSVRYIKGYELLVKYTDQVMISFRRIAGQQVGVALVRTANRLHGYHG